MKVLIVGKKHLNFKNDKTNEVVDVCTLFCTHKNPFSDNTTQYEGIGCSQVNVPEQIFNSLEVDREYLMDFDKKGKLLEVTEL